MHSTQLKLNPEKCVFGVQKGKVLGCLVCVKGIEAKPDKINDIVDMKPPQSEKEVQRLTGKIAALNRFMAKLAERSLPFWQYSGAPKVFSGPRAAGNFRHTQRSHTKVAHAGKSSARSTTNPICLRHTYSGKRSHCARKRDMQRGQKAFTTSAYIFCF
jgi:hypothetical protein